jgi:hypothetical protein
MSDKKPVIIFSTADKRNFPHAVSFFNSLTKFHQPGELDMLLYTDEDNPDQLKRLPKGVRTADITPFLANDPAFWYRQKPIISEPLLDQYEVVIGADADQLVLGDISYLWKTEGYDVATVINWNRVDPQLYGFVEIGRIGIAPIEYFNCGLVALRSKKFAHVWKSNCFYTQFERMQYREQDILNIMCYFGNWNVRCLDHQDTLANVNAWWGLIAKGELNRAELRGEEIVVPKGEGDTPFPPVDTTLKIVHLGGGAGAPKDNWGAYFNPAVMERINYLKGASGTT